MDDRVIVQMYLDRDEDAILKTKEKYEAYCYAISNDILENYEDAQECVNDTYLRAWNSIPPQKPVRLSTYLGKIVRNLSFDRYKKNTATKRGGGQMKLILDELEDIVSENNTPVDEVERKELIRTINEYLTNVSKRKRQLFVCRYWYADSIRNIANRYNMTENYVSVILNRMRAELRTYLSERGFEL